MIPPRPTALACMILRETIRPGDTVIDATAGNGHDTLFLAETVGPTGRVLAFDLQENAIRSATARIHEAGYGPRVDFHQISHSRMADHAAEGSISTIMFNLGYLPGDDHRFTTQSAETLTALEAATRLLAPGGALSIVCYPGHPAGAIEAADVEAWLTRQTTHGWRVARYAISGTRLPAPFLLLASKP